MDARGFDRVLFLESLGHSHDLAAALATARRALRPGGSVYIKDVFRTANAIDAEQRAELAEFCDTYAFQAPLAGDVLRAAEEAGFVDVRGDAIDGLADMGPFHAAMFEAGAGDRPRRTRFGVHHDRGFERLPVEVWEVFGRTA
jgi:ubiquinone/menaquinone biosynthesis C-methylase UbiE